MDAPAAHTKTPFRTALKKGRPVRWCACGLSARQPFCDESHRGGGVEPVVYRAPEDITVALCGCKLTAHPPFCDGSHIELAKQEPDKGS